MHSHCGCDDCMTDLLCAEPADRRGGHNPYLAVFLPEVHVIRHNPKKQKSKTGTTKDTKVHEGNQLWSSFVNLRVLGGYSLSKIPAAPMPPPTHMVTMP
jgi:hypothetical protein